jgi:7,8-dihydroneopterin aldolase/epimerase/oxygenase
MKLTESKIVLKGMRFHSYHGVVTQERLTGNDFVVDLCVYYPIEKAMCSDSLEDTLNYADLYKVVEQEMHTPSFLLERVSGRIAERLFRTFPSIQAVDLNLMKMNPPMGADCDSAGIESHFINVDK